MTVAVPGRQAPQPPAIANRGPWFRVWQERPNATHRLFCFHHAGGTAGSFRAFAAQAEQSMDAEIVGVQLPGRADRNEEGAVSRLAELADAIVAALLPWNDLPMAFLGLSMGGTLAFEVAVRIEEQRYAEMRSVLVCSSRPPHLPPRQPLHRLSARGLAARLRRAGGIAPGLDCPDLFAYALPTLRADLEAVENHPHREGVRLRCPLTAVVGIADPLLSVQDARGWFDLGCRAELLLLDGGHFLIDSHPADVLGALGRQVRPAPPPRWPLAQHPPQTASKGTHEHH